MKLWSGAETCKHCHFYYCSAANLKNLNNFHITVGFTLLQHFLLQKSQNVRVRICPVTLAHVWLDFREGNCNLCFGQTSTVKEADFGAPVVPAVRCDMSRYSPLTSVLSRVAGCRVTRHTLQATVVTI